MRTVLRSLACIACLTVIPASATAQEGDGGGTSDGNRAFGLGVQSMLRGPGGIAATFDIGLMHIDAILFFVDTDGGGGAFGGGDALGLAGRAFYSVHQTNASDLGVGGGIGFTIDKEPGDDDTIISIELGAKMRAFIVSNVALTAFLGAAIVVDDDDEGGDNGGLVLGGQQVGSFSTVGLAGGFGFTYYFN